MPAVGVDLHSLGLNCIYGSLPGIAETAPFSTDWGEDGTGCGTDPVLPGGMGVAYSSPCSGKSWALKGSPSPALPRPFPLMGLGEALSLWAAASLPDLWGVK